MREAWTGCVLYWWQCREEKFNNDVDSPMETITDSKDVLNRHLMRREKFFKYTPTEEVAGWPGVVHGGMQMLVLSHLAEDRFSPFSEKLKSDDSKKIIIRFHQPVRTGQSYAIHLTDVDSCDNKLSLGATIRTSQGAKLTYAEFLLQAREQAKTQTDFQHYQPSDSTGSLSTILQWPVWQTCCLNPVQKHMEVDASWHLSPEGKGITGVVEWPEGKGNIDQTAMALALMDQGLGFCGQRDGCQMLLTIRLEVEMLGTPCCGEKHILVCHGRKRTAKTYSADSLLLRNGTLLARGHGLFRIF